MLQVSFLTCLILNASHFLNIIRFAGMELNMVSVHIACVPTELLLSICSKPNFSEEKLRAGCMKVSIPECNATQYLFDT